jgi:hypothetical protein
MNKNVVAAMSDLVDFFGRYCTERTTLDELRKMFPDRPHWQKAHDLFGRIREKTLKATKQENQLLVAQYNFEEVCAKTLYNLGLYSAPFDPDSPYRVVPKAFELARCLKLDDLEIVHTPNHF